MEVRQFDINNPNPRTIRCISTTTEVNGGENGEKLILNKAYKVKIVEKCNSHTRVYVEEHPDIGFNSLLFGEL